MVNFRVNVQNIHFLVLYSALPCSPKSDMCKTCDAFNMSVNAEEDPEKKQALTAEWELHKSKAERAYHQLQEDTASCKASCDVDMLYTRTVAGARAFPRNQETDSSSWLRSNLVDCVTAWLIV